jgi:hypothetical protein
MEQYKKKKIRKRGNFSGVKEAVNAKNSYFRRRNLEDESFEKTKTQQAKNILKMF